MVLNTLVKKIKVHAAAFFCCCCCIFDTRMIYTGLNKQNKDLNIIAINMLHTSEPLDDIIRIKNNFH